MPFEIETNCRNMPDLSMIMPCYNEEAIIGYTIPRLFIAFQRSGYHLELIAVDNGSWDKTGEILQDLASIWESLVIERVDVNQGYGYGVISGISIATAPWVGIIQADGQVDAEDVVRLYEAVVVTDGKVIGKVRRRFRMDGLRREIVSLVYNLFFKLLWPSIESTDINGNPKILPREVLQVMDLKSKGWMIDPELMIKGHHMGLRVLEFNVFSRMRGNGVSHVRMGTVWEFLRNMLRFRFSPQWNAELRKPANTLKSTESTATALPAESLFRVEKPSENI